MSFDFNKFKEDNELILEETLTNIIEFENKILDIQKENFQPKWDYLYSISGLTITTNSQYSWVQNNGKSYIYKLKQFEKEKPLNEEDRYKEMYSIAEILLKSNGLECEIIWSAMKAIQENSDTKISEAIDIGTNEWVKQNR